ncbi:MAG TPA: ATP-binding protein [Oligoflexus sp.]|uniref:ATP-binding protein n=1 Tax=Oligoflexus sp. TaxID=1971216 RepID=UPI002D804399|nr:ATP-binding protein [Oligoflexus sp.]HET9237065.1 ATP-binding protein [Oligoflexus sp.]
MREKAPIILIVSIGIFLLSLFGLFRQREAASLKETIPHDLVAAEASLMDRFSATHRSLGWLFEQHATRQGGISSLPDALRNYLAQHTDLICLAVLDMKGEPQLVLPEHEKALVASILQQRDLKTWITEAESRGKEVFTPGLGLAGGRQSIAQALPILEGGRIAHLVLVVYDLDLLLQHNLPKWVQQKYEAALVNASHRPLAILNRQPSSELTTSLRSRHDLTGHQVYLRLSAFPQSLGWQPLTLLALGVAILISASIVLINLSRDLQKRRMQAEDFRQQNKIIEAANTAKDQFIASMSHEIRTPLSAIMGYTEIMASRQQTMIPEIQGIRRNSQHLSKLLGDLLDYSRLQADILVPQRETFAVESLLRELAAATVPQAQAKGLMIEVRGQGPIPDRMDSDPVRLRQILINLLGNAIKFTDQGTIRLEIAEIQKAEGPVLRLAVDDTGIGIPEDEKHLLFQSFTQLTSHQKRGVSGSGLGLAISRRLAELLEGRLYLESSTVGKGSCFVLELDRYEAPGMIRAPLNPLSLDGYLKQTGQTPELALIPRTILRGRVILVTDDDDDNRQILSHLLTMAGAEVYEARDGQEALTRIERTALSCILLDLSMPGMNGYETLAHIKELGLKIPIFALTASALSTERSKALAAGFQGFYTKPLSFQTFPEHLADQLLQLTGTPAPSADKTEPQPAPQSQEGFRELRARFCERLAARLERLNGAWTRQDSLELRRESHSLVGTADQYGFHELAAAARQLEGLCQDETLEPAAGEAYRRLEDHIAVILRNQG